MFVFLGMREEQPRQKPALRTKIVDAIIVNPGTIQPQITGYGKIVSAQPIPLISEVSGILESGNIAFKPGASFKKGDLLAKIDDRQARLSLNSQKSDFLNAMAMVLPELKVDFPDAYPEWQKYFDETTFDTPVKPLPEVKDSKLKLYISRFNIYKLFFAIRQAEIFLEKHYFYAPFNGSIVTTELRKGSSARAGSRLGEIINLDDLEVEIPLPAGEIDQIDSKKTVRLFSRELGQTWQGRIARIGKNINERTQSVPVYIELSNNGTAPPSGVFIDAQLPGQKIENGIMVPRRAIYDDEFVYLIKNKKLHYQKVGIKIVQEETAVITQGLAPGDSLVIELLQGVAPGMRADARLLEAKKEAGL